MPTFILFVLCFFYINSLFAFRDNSVKSNSQTLKIFGIILLVFAAIALLGAISGAGTTWSVNRAIRIAMINTTILGGWGVFLLICQKPYRVLWRRIGITVAYIIWTGFLSGASRPGCNIYVYLCGCFIMFIIIRYLKEGDKYESKRIEHIS